MTAREAKELIKELRIWCEAERGRKSVAAERITSGLTTAVLIAAALLLVATIVALSVRPNHRSPVRAITTAIQTKIARSVSLEIH